MAEEGISTATIWKIKNFTKLPAKRLQSDVFVVDGYRWWLSAYPKGNNMDDHLSLYLNVADSSTFPDGWSIDTESFSITVSNQVHVKDSIEEIVTEHHFDARSPNWGFPSFMPLSKLSDPAKGYLVNDTLVVEARVFVSTESSSNLLKKTKNLLAELSSMDGATPGNEISPPNPLFLEQQRKALADYLALSSEAIKQTSAFDEIERLVQQSCLATLEGIVLPTMKSSIENVKDRLMSLSGKSADVGPRLEQCQEQLSSFDAKYSKLSDDELGFEAEILRLITQRQELLIRKKIMVLELEKVNMEQASKDLAEWRDIIKETEGLDENWQKTREKLVHAKLNRKRKVEPS